MAETKPQMRGNTRSEFVAAWIKWFHADNLIGMWPGSIETMEEASELSRMLIRLIEKIADEKVKCGVLEAD